MKAQLIDKKFILFLTSLIICLSYSVRASALDYSFTEENPINGSKVEHYKFLLMRGKIEVGDYQKLKDFLRVEPALTYFANSRQIIISSPGGDVREALKLGDFVRKTFSEVSVGNHFGSCMSSCFLVLASAVSRNWQENTVGLHRPYLTAEAIERKSASATMDEQERAMTAVDAYLKHLRVPHHLVNIMMSTPSDKIVWLDEPNITFGRLSPSYEQMLVTKCGLDIDLGRRYFSGKKDVSARKILDSRECGYKLTFKDGMNYFVSELGGNPPFSN